MKDRPILFSAPMVRAILAGTKSQTRRPVKPQPYEGGRPEHWSISEFPQFCPYGQPGDRLWLREAWRTTGDGGRCNDMPPRDLQAHEVWYEAEGHAPSDECAGKLRPSMFMPRWASRITLELTDVRVERLQDISEADALAEGIVPAGDGNGFQLADTTHYSGNPIDSYFSLWEHINGPGSVEVNPWVWVVEFKRTESA